MTRKRTSVPIRRHVTLMIISLLVAGDLFQVPQANAQPPGQGSVRHSSQGAKRAGTPGRSTPGRSTAGRVTPGRVTPGRSSPGRVAPARRPGGRRPAPRRSNYRYAARKDARRDYYRWRTINHLIRVGARIALTPRQTTTVVVSGSTYYYAGGVYYVKSGTSYVVVHSPPGAVVYTVPAATTVVYVNQTPYYYYGGTYYVVTSEPAQKPPPVEEGQAEPDGAPEVPPMADTADDENYEVVEPPIGATVPYVPEEAAEETVNGKKYLVYEGTYYRPFASDGETIYMVVEDPRKTSG